MLVDRYLNEISIKACIATRSSGWEAPLRLVAFRNIEEVYAKPYMLIYIGSVTVRQSFGLLVGRFIG